MGLLERTNLVIRIKNFKVITHLQVLLGFAAVDATRKKQLTVFTPWGFPFTALTFRIPRKNVRMCCFNIRVTGKKNHLKPDLSCGNAEMV